MIELPLNACLAAILSGPAALNYARVGLGPKGAEEMLHALSNWLTDLPTTAAAVVSMIGAAAVSTLGLFGVHWTVPHEIRSVHNDVSGFTLTIIGIVYAVFLAFIAVAVWEDYGRAEMVVQTEANLVGNLYRDTVSLPEPMASQLRHTLYVYAETVAQDEWRALASGQENSAAGWQLLDSAHSSIVQLRSPDLTTATMQGAMVRTLNELYDARRGRYQAAAADLPPILWWNLLAGAVILMVGTYLFGAPNILMHATMVGSLGASIGLVLVLIVILNSPFRGENHVSVEPFEALLRTVETMAYPHS